MDLYRLRIVPESPWLTSWQSDTLAGLLCWACARTLGGNALRREILEPALASQPAFVLSDAFPGDWLPVPQVVRTAAWPAEHRKLVKRARWMAHETFQGVQRGRLPPSDELIQANGWFTYMQLRNCIGRSSNTTAQGGGLFPKEECVLDRGTEYVSIYARIEASFVARFCDLIHAVAEEGFGADVSAGKGQFRLAGEPEAIGWLDDVPQANGAVALSTFQPAPTDSADGLWEAFTKYGKLGPDFGVGNVFKRPLVLLRPGACFRAGVSRGWLGRAIPMHELLAPDVATTLNGRDASVVHLAFGLAVPLMFDSAT